jgi:serine/threonine protein kinase
MFLNEINDIKLASFVIAKKMENSHASTHAGTLFYMSPEVFMAHFIDTKYYPNTDVW